MRYFFTKGFIKPTELLSSFQKKQENEIICVKFHIMLNFCHEKVTFINFMPLM